MDRQADMDDNIEFFLPPACPSLATKVLSGDVVYICPFPHDLHLPDLWLKEKNYTIAPEKKLFFCNTELMRDESI